MQIHTFSFVAACLALGTCLSFGAEARDPSTLPAPKRTVVPRLAGEIKVDGKLDEAVWEKAAALGPFLKNDGSGQESESTRVRIWYDDQALYMGWTCRDTDIQATFKARDSKFWEEEVAEFFLTSGDLRRYYELQWNPLGGVFDAIITNDLDEKGASKNFKGDWDYTAAGMKSAVIVDGTVAKSDDQDRQWQVEVMVPFADLKEAAPKAGAVWRANFYRFNRAKGREAELISWSPTLYPSFHQPARFGFLEFGEAKQSTK